MKKNKLIFYWVLVIFSLCFVFSSCEDIEQGFLVVIPDPEDEDPWVEGEVVPITEADITNNLVFPTVNSSKPATFDADRFTGNVKWFYSVDGDGWLGALGDRFYSGMVYRAEVVINAKKWFYI